MTLTDVAAEKVRDFIENFEATENAGLRVSVLPGGCSGFKYGLNIEETFESDDEIFELQGIKIFIDPFSSQYLDGIEIDYTSSMMGQGFVFNNPKSVPQAGSVKHIVPLHFPSTIFGKNLSLIKEDNRQDNSVLSLGLSILQINDECRQNHNKEIIIEINNDEIGVNDKLSFYVREINKISENSSKLKSFKNKFIEIKNKQR